MNKNSGFQNFPADTVVKIPLERAWVQSLVRELPYATWCGPPKKKNLGSRREGRV